MSQKNKGILYIVLSAFCFALMNFFVRLSGNLPSIQKSFFRNFIAMIIAYMILYKEGSGFKPQKNTLKFLIIRSVCGTLGILCNYYAIDHLVLADASMLNKLSPFFAIIFSFIFLKEKVHWFEGLSVLIAFTGGLFIIKPTMANAALLPSIIGMLGGMAAGAAYTAVRHLGNLGERKSFIVFFFSAFSCLVTLPYLIFHFHPMTPMQIVTLLFAGISAAGGQFAITTAYTYAPAKEISVFDYSQIVFAAALGFLFFHQIPDIYSFIGYIIICGVAIINFVRKNNETATPKTE